MNRWISAASYLVALLAVAGFFVYNVGSARDGQLHLSSSFTYQAFAQLLHVDDQQVLHTVDSTDSWDVIEHLGGNSPWIPKRHSVANESLEPPNGCYVDQVHMVSAAKSRSAFMRSHS